VLLGGFAIALPIVMGGAGGVSAVISPPAALALPEGYASWWGGAASLGFVVLLVPPFIVSPGLLQKTYGARDERAVRLGIGANGVVLLLFAFVPALLGMAARAQFPGLPYRELALPTLFMRDLPAGVGALALAAVFSAEVSTADAVLFMLATSLSQDLYRRFVKPEATDRQLLRAARLAAVVGGVAAVGLALVSDSIITALSLFYALLGVTLFVPVLAGLMSPRTSRNSALAAIVAGVGVDLLLRASGAWRPTLLTPELGGLVAAAVAAMVARYRQSPAR